jgi:tRNA A-37 threonylcarbamoyl transferase component Bud32
MIHKNIDCYRATSYLLPLRLWIGKKLFGVVGPCGVRVSPNRMIKGPCATPELAALKYVAEHTSIPVPKVFNTHYHDGDLYIEMEIIRGMNLEAAWYHSHLSQDQKKDIIAEVAGHISQLRKLEPPREGMVASASLGEAMDHRVGSCTFGPFTSHKGFHSYLRANAPIEDCNEVFGPEVTECHSRHYRSCFTHADIAPRNIMVDDGKVSAIVDWQFGGWYPEYWEYTKAHYGQIDRPEWYDGLEDAMERYDDELRAEQTLWRRLDEPQLLWRGKEHLTPSLDLA